MRISEMLREKGRFDLDEWVEGEARRDDERFCHAAVWEHRGDGEPPARHTEPLVFEHVKLATRSYR